MAESNTNDFEGALEFLLLSGFSEGPRSLSEIQRCCKRAEWLLDLAAARKGKPGIDSITGALGRLQREGWLRFVSPEKQPNIETIYVLTEAGEQRLEHERARRNWIVSQFVEKSELDQSFRQFLDSQGSLWLGGK